MKRWRRMFVAGLLLIAVGATGQPLQVWLTGYNSQSSQTSYDMIRTESGNYAHVIRTPYSGDALYLIAPDGTEIWHHTYGAMGNFDNNVSLLELPGGGFLLAGQAWIDEQGDDGEYDARLIRTDAGGNVVWTAHVGENSYDYGAGVVRTDDGRIYLAGDSYHNFEGEATLWEIAPDSTLVNTSWFSTDSHPKNFSDINLTADGNLIMCGGGYATDYERCGYVVKCDLDGNLIWQHDIDPPYNQHITDIEEAPDGTFFFAGNTAIDEAGTPVCPWYGKLDADGNVIFLETYTGSQQVSYFYCCTQDSDGNWLLGGRFEGPGDPHQDALLLKVSHEDGSLIWELFEGDPAAGSDEGFSDVIVHPDGYYVAVGDGDFGALSHPGFIACYSLTGSDVERITPPSRVTEFELLSVWPNPFNATQTISLSLPSPGSITVDLVNTQGRVVNQLASGFYPTGEHQLTWTADGLGSGVYFVRAVAPGGVMQARRVVLVK